MPRVLVPVSHPVGGIRTYMIYNLSILNRQGYQFTFLSAQGSSFDAFKKDTAGWDGTEFIDVPDGISAKAAFFAIRNAVKSRRYDLIHSQGLRSGTLAQAALLSRCSAETRIKHIITLHDVIVPQNDIPGKFKWLKKKITGALTRRASVIIPVSNDCAENHLQHFPAWKKGPVKIVPILNGIRINDFSAAAGENENITLGFFGRFMPQKGFDVLLKALEIVNNKPGISPFAERYTNAKIKLLATIDRHGYTNETLNAVEKNPVLKEIIHFTESVPDITPLWNEIDALVMPSRWEACPLLPMEALAAGIPVIGSDCLGLREVLAGTNCPMPEAGDAQALADAILHFIGNSAALRCAVVNYAAATKKRFDVKVAAEKLLAVYRGLT